MRLHINCNSWLRKRFSCVTASITSTDLSLLDLHWEWNPNFYPKMKQNHCSKRSYNNICTQSQKFNICFPFTNPLIFFVEKENDRSSMGNWWLIEESDCFQLSQWIQSLVPQQWIEPQSLTLHERIITSDHQDRVTFTLTPGENMSSCFKPRDHIGHQCHSWVIV